jgi:hypothetical protein
MDIRHLEIAGALYLPALILGIIAFGAVHMSLVVAFILAGLLLAGFFAFVVAFRTD